MPADTPTAEDASKIILFMAHPGRDHRVGRWEAHRPNLEGAGEIPLRRLVKEALHMRPSWLMG
jgi:Flp pilus assembly CpaF family ATPase